MHMRFKKAWAGWSADRMLRTFCVWLLAFIVLAAVATGCRRPNATANGVLASYTESSAYPLIEISYPLDQTIFPPEITPPVFKWQDTCSNASNWAIRIRFSGGGPDLSFLVQSQAWSPGPRQWEEIKRRSKEQWAEVTILGLAQGGKPEIVSRGRVTFKTSKDEVGAPIFYRDVNLPFIEAVQDPRRIRWRFGSISSESPRVVLEGLPVCGNCHSFSRDGSVLGMDVDYANNKGSYIVTRTARYMTLSTSEIITWDDYKREDGDLTYGFLSQVSPDGRYVISTVKDKSVFVAKPDLAFSQLFFPIKGILVVYSCSARTFKALPGADDPRYVQSNPVWSPDGQYIVFARAPAYQLKQASAKNKLLLSPAECEEFLKDGKPFKYDLYRIPFNDGNGGEPEPLEGASNNGYSNYFPRYSPDGKWIVFCRARNYMLLQPDSELYIIPASGGQARRLRANTNRMNSWHSWSPNGRWLVFASKANSPYTQLFLTHIDENGESSPPVVLDRFTAPDRAANIPEFVNLPPDAIIKIREQFVDDYSMARAAHISETQGAIDDAIRDYKKALEINPRNVPAHQRLGFLLYNMKGQKQEGLSHTLEALRLDPNDGCAHFDLGMALLEQGKVTDAIVHLDKAVQILPEGFEGRYNPANMRFYLGMALLMGGDPSRSAVHLSEALKHKPDHSRAHHCIAFALARLGRPDEAAVHYAKAVELDPAIDTAAELPDIIAAAFAAAGRYAEAVDYATRALTLAQKTGNHGLALEIRERLEHFRQQRSY